MGKKTHDFQCHPIFQLIKFHELNDISGLTVFLLGRSFVEFLMAGHVFSAQLFV